ncbi:MAG: response regulator [Pseudomonadota bacterium]|nr:response regulator [Pseudomonadota bacterium]
MTKDPINILLVDDQPAKLLSYVAILQDLGENLITAGSAREALEQLLKKDIAIVLSDVCMPELDGFELAGMIRDHPRFQQTAIIFVSAVALTDPDRIKGYSYGAVDYLLVPVVPELLRAKVRVFADLFRKTRQLELLNAELERRVEERTVELTRANVELERRVEERTRERETAWAQVQQLQKLESLGQLTGGIAHDFNNLLQVISGNLEILSRRLSDDVDIKSRLARAAEAVDRGTTLTERLLAFARRQDLKLEAVDVPRLINGMTDMLRRSLGPTIEIAVELEDGLPAIRTDANQLDLALLNVALNARDAMPNGGRLQIAVRRENVKAGSVRCLNAGKYVCIAVTDTGIGMDEATLRRASEPFFTTKELGKGTGLGLSMVYGVAAQSQGALCLASQVGGGTTVELYFPIAEPDAADPPRPASLDITVAWRSCNVLLVDDDPMVADTTASMLQSLGHQVLVAPSGTEALNVLQGESTIDLVITDHAMPHMTGSELADQIRGIRPNLPIILATGYAELSGPEESGLPRLCKPYCLEDLISLMDEVLIRQNVKPPS